MKYLFLLIIILISHSCLRYPILPIKEEDYTPRITPDVFIIYSKSEYSEGIPKIGSYQGYDFQIKNTGDVLVYAIYHRWGYKLVDEFRITNSELEKLDSLFQNVGFQEFPGLVPQYRNKYRFPSDSYSIKYRPYNNSEFKIVNISSFSAAKKYYPNGFFTLTDTIKEILFSYSKWKR